MLRFFVIPIRFLVLTFLYLVGLLYCLLIDYRFFADNLKMGAEDFREWLRWIVHGKAQNTTWF